MKVVIGLGKTGLSCIRHFVDRGEIVAVVDTRPSPPGLEELRRDFPDIQTSFGSLDNHLLQSAEELIVSPGLSLKTPAIANAMAAGARAVGDIELLCRSTSKPIIAITGSNAKSTVTTLVGEMANASGQRVAVAGNIGWPALDALKHDAQLDTYVLELSSFQLETTWSLSAQVATILNISPDHLDRYDSMRDYIEAKQRIYQSALHQVYFSDDRETVPAFPARGRRITFGSRAADVSLVNVREAVWLTYGDTPLMCVDELRIKGRHNAINALSALAIGIAAGFDVPSMCQALRTFAGLPHRCQWVREHAGVAWYNDSKGTNVGATVAAIEGLGSGIRGKIVLIAGGDGKGADFVELVAPTAQYVKSAVLIGRDGPRLSQVLRSSCTTVSAESLSDAVSRAAELAEPGDIVLLSPACASFDMFSGYEDRGRQFVAAVEAL